MAGYMGFGLQRWIYTMRPRKPYSMDRKKSCNEIESYERTFKLQASKDTNNFSILLSMVLLVLAIVIFVSSISKFEAYAKERQNQLVLHENIENAEAFKFLFNSGVKRMQFKNYKGAYSEFMLALKIAPNHIQTNQLLLETLTILCEMDVSYCEKLDEYDFYLGEN